MQHFTLSLLRQNIACRGQCGLSTCPFLDFNVLHAIEFRHSLWRFHGREPYLNTFRLRQFMIFCHVPCFGRKPTKGHFVLWKVPLRCYFLSFIFGLLLGIMCDIPDITKHQPICNEWILHTLTCGTYIWIFYNLSPLIGRRYLKPSLVKDLKLLSCIINTMVPNDLTMLKPEHYCGF